MAKNKKINVQGVDILLYQEHQTITYHLPILLGTETASVVIIYYKTGCEAVAQ